jgi:hypothetical protein
MWYQTFLLVHIMAAMAWVGGGIVIQVTQQTALRHGGPPAFDDVGRRLAWTDTWLAVLAPFLVLATGIGMVVVDPGWRFSQTWIWLTLAIVGLYQLLAYTIGVRLFRLIAAEATGSRASFVKLGHVLIGLLAGVVVLMVFKPG